jgi:hypothetical protein
MADTDDTREEWAALRKTQNDPKPASRGFVMSFMTTICEGLVESLSTTLRERFEKSDRRIEQLEQRIFELEARPHLRYCGVFRDGEQYQPGVFVTHAGAVWHANRRTGDRPGTSDAWQLAVKSARR